MAAWKHTTDTTATGSIWQRLRTGVRIIHEHSSWKRFVGSDWVENIMQVPVTDRFHAKQGRSIGRWSLEHQGRRLTVYLKRHYRLPLLHGLLACLWPRISWSPAVQEWHHLQWARTQGLPVPNALAAGEFIGPWGRLQSFLAVEELTDMLPLHEAVPLAEQTLPPNRFLRWKRQIVKEMARITGELHRRRAFHKDLYLCHFYAPLRSIQQGSLRSGDLHIIDLHRLARHRWSWRWWQLKDLAQLLYSSDVAGVSERDRFYFWHCYLGSERLTLAARLLRIGVVLKGRRYRQHNNRQRLARKEAAA